MTTIDKPTQVGGLPEPVAVIYPDTGLRNDSQALKLWAWFGYDTGGEPLFSADQMRANVQALEARVKELEARLVALRDEWVRDATRWNIGQGAKHLHRCAKDIDAALLESKP